jgi:NADPH-dependent 2,4-dienoyl-CoA reductase/sulfur reductase-like enzyme
MSDGIVIAGGGLAAQRAAEALRRHGYEGVLRVICGEPHRPYDRPPLSKELLSGECEPESLHFRADDWYDEHDVDLLVGVRATSLSPRRRRVGLSDQSVLTYDKLLIATGSQPRRLGVLAGYENVSELSTLDDALRLRDALASRPRLAVVGAGFIGMEVAATARRLGAAVTMIEAAPRPLSGVLGKRMGNWFADLHRAEGVDVLTSCTVSSVDGAGAAQRLHLSDGRRVEADHIVVGVGVAPDLDWLAGSGLDSSGVRVNAHGRTEIEGVFAAGDAASTYDEHFQRHLPGSHWEAAGRQAARAARAMLALDPGNAELSSFWTDQYGIRIQYVGHAPLADSLAIDGEPHARDFTATYTRAGRPVGALLVNRTRSLPEIRKLINEGDKHELHSHNR